MLRKDRHGQSIFVLASGSPASPIVRGVYLDSREAMDGAGNLLNGGIEARIFPVSISVPGGGELGDSVYLWTAKNGASMIAFSTIDAADAQRERLGGGVRAYQIQGATGAKAYGGGDLRKSSDDMELLKVIALGSQQDFPADSNDPETRAAAYALGFARQIRKAFASPKKMGARL